MEETELLQNVAKGFCPNCGEALVQNHTGRPRKFCSTACRNAWRWSHPNVKNWKSTRTVICPVCLKSFLANREYGKARKYCSHACANRGRSQKGGDVDG